MFIEVTNVSGLGDVQLFVSGDHVVVKAGESVKVPPELAGRPPEWRAAEYDEGGRLLDDPDVMATRLARDGLEVWDLGEGLLAQVENWQAVDGADAPPKAETREDA